MVQHSPAVLGRPKGKQVDDSLARTGIDVARGELTPRRDGVEDVWIAEHTLLGVCVCVCVWVARWLALCVLSLAFED